MRDVRHRRERLLSGAYWCVTRLEREYGGRARAAERLNVSRNVFTKLGKLTYIDDPERARKAGGPKRSLTPEEKTWVLNALAGLTLRVGEASASDPSQLLRLTVRDSVPASIQRGYRSDAQTSVRRNVTEPRAGPVLTYWPSIGGYAAKR